MTEKDEREKLQKKLVWAARKVLWEGDSWGEDLMGITDSAMWFTGGGLTLWLSESEARDYQEALKVITEFAPLVHSYSKKTLIQLWRDLLVQLAGNYEDQPSIEVLDEEVETWLETALSAKKQEFTYYTVIDNLTMEEEEQIGRVIFGPLTIDAKKQIRNGIWSLLDDNPHYSEKPDELSRLKEYVSESLEPFSESSTKSLAWTKIATRDALRGQELAVQAIDESLNFLRYIGAQASGSIRRPIGMQGIVGEGLRTIPVISVKTWQLHRERVSFVFDLQRLRQKSLGFVELERILRNAPEARDELESKLAGALVWLGQSAEEISETAHFLKVWIAVEMLLRSEEERAPGGIVGERMAFLLESSLERRRQVADLMRRIYMIRNDLVHKGKAKNDEDVVRYLPYARTLAVNVLNRVVELKEENGWTEFKDLKEYVENLKYS